MIGALVRSLLDADSDLDPFDVADVLWLLAAWQHDDADPKLRRSGAVSMLAPRGTATDATPRADSDHPAEHTDLTAVRDVVAGSRAPASQDSQALTSEAPLRTAARPSAVAGATGRRVSLTGTTHLNFDMLRPLRMFRGLRGRGPGTQIDIDATVEATADAQLVDPTSLVVVSRPECRRLLDVVLVVDAGPSMAVWRDVAGELQRLIEQVGAFRSVSRWDLVALEPGADSESVVRDTTGGRYSTDRIIDASGHRLVVVLTDAVAAAWYGAPRWRAVSRWSRTMPTVLVQVLPRRYWPGTGIRDLPAVAQARRPAAPNSSLRVEYTWWSDQANGTGDPTALPVPVIALNEESLQSWASAVVAGTQWVDATVAAPTKGSYPRDRDSSISADRRIRDFDARASEGAYRLARILSGAPILTLPLIRVLQASLVPGAGVTELAEVFVAGLLEEDAPGSAGDTQRLRFRPGVAAILQGGSSALEEWDTFAAVTEHLTKRHGGRRDLSAVLADPDGTAGLDPDEQPFGLMLVRLGRRLGLTQAQPGGNDPDQALAGSAPPSSTSRTHAPATEVSRSGEAGAPDPVSAARLKPADAEALANLGVPAEFDEGTILMHQGADADGVVLLLSGRVKIVNVEDSGQETLLAMRGPGDLVGEMAAFEEGRRSATVVALEQVHTVVVPIPDFLEFVSSRPGVAAAVLGLMASRLRAADRQLARLGAFPTAVRLSQHLLSLAADYGRPEANGGVVLDVRLTQAKIASAIGGSRESVNRDLAYLRARGMIATDRRHIVLLDLPALRSFAIDGSATPKT